MADPRITRLARTIRDGGELGPEQRELLADLLYRVDAAADRAAEAGARHPGAALATAIDQALCWNPVATGFRALLAAVDDVPAPAATARTVDLSDTAGCPDGQRCENCGTAGELEVCTVVCPLGVYCLTLCPACPWPVDPGGWPRATERVLAHCVHLGIDADQMATTLRGHTPVMGRGGGK